MPWGLLPALLTAGPLAAGATAKVYGCEPQAGPCATFTINAVHAELAALLPVSGVGQSLLATASPLPVTLQVIDGGGQPLAGATVNFYQPDDCPGSRLAPTSGRCAAPLQLGSATSTAVSDMNGLVTLTAHEQCRPGCDNPGAGLHRAAGEPPLEHRAATVKRSRLCTGASAPYAGPQKTANGRECLYASLRFLDPAALRLRAGGSYSARAAPYKAGPRGA